MLSLQRIQAAVNSALSPRDISCCSENLFFSVSTTHNVPVTFSCQAELSSEVLWKLVSFFTLQKIGL